MVTFAELCDAMALAGVEVHLALREDGRHVLELRDLHRVRSLSHVVVRSFDATAQAVCCSLALCSSLGADAPDGPGARLAARWPELVELVTARAA